MVYTRKIYFSGGDFHELQAVFEVLPGVCNTRTGYINPAAGLAAAADVYAAVAAGTIPAVMGLEITYNPKKMDLSMLMDVLFAVVNPQLPDGQGKVYRIPANVMPAQISEAFWQAKTIVKGEDANGTAAKQDAENTSADTVPGVSV